MRPITFQSSSSPKAGCYMIICLPVGGGEVSILIQPEGWMLSLDGKRVFMALIVSILIQPEGWMLCSRHINWRWSLLFQSSSSPKAGCYLYQFFIGALRRGFNPHPARRLDAIKANPCLGVSVTMFQSSSSPKAGCYKPDQPHVSSISGFNPHPARRLDAI